MLYIFPCSVSLPSQSVQLLLTFFCFQSSIQIYIACPFAITTAFFALLFFVQLFTIFISYFVPCFLCLFLLCSSVLPHSTTTSTYLLFVSQMLLPVQSQQFFLAFPLLCSTYQVTHPCLPKSWSPPV